MRKQDNKRKNHVRNLVVAVTLSAIILTVSTYAWFIGMKTVNVSSFDVKIAAIDSLSLSLNGTDFSDTVAINESNFNKTDDGTVYAGNTNSWGGTGLIPMSSIGKIDTTSNRMIMYEKGSLTTTDGGYRLLASRVKNTDADAKEANGYVAFDLFVKNLSGNAYYDGPNVANEEAIYLTTDSAVTAAVGGDKEGVAGTGIENSVRVAFAQIGRVKADKEGATVTGITCTSGGDVTGICANRDAQIWEPNDILHVANAINWYNTSCKNRTGDDTYSGSCTTVQNGVHYRTFAVAGVIDDVSEASKLVDSYDGDYNGYTGSVASSTTVGTEVPGKLYAYDTFTDTEKNLAGTERPTFMTLAPNSITKVRVYIWIEGQDIDNYDFASLGRQISVQFGFTKERFFDKDVDYDSAGTATLPDDVIKANHSTMGD